jgi:hypothetical protein
MEIRYKLIIFIIFCFQFLFAQSPGNVSGNIQLWLKANTGVLDTGGGAASDGEAVGTWQDQTTARTNDAVDDRLAAPDYRNNATNNINGNPVIEFNGTNDGLDFGNDYIYSTGTGMTWFAVLKPNDEPATKTRQKIIDFGFYANAGYGFSYGDNAYSYYTSTNNGGAVTVDQTHNNGTNPAIVTYQIDFGTDQTMAFNGASPVSTQAITLTALGDAQVDQAATHGTNNGPFTIGQQAKTATIDNNDGRYYSGFIGEIIGYAADLSDDNKNKVETYLALKYGLTLNHNYIADIGGSNITVFDISGYSNNIAGVAQDAADQVFTQLSSKSIHTNALVRGAIADANIDDEEYVIWGHNAASADLGTTFDGLPNTRINRIWKVTETGTVGSMTISIPTSVAGGLTHLVVSNSETITNTAGLASQSALTINGDFYEATVTFTGTQYFTFITDTPGGSGSPGGIASNLLLWLKADAGVLNGASAATDGQSVNTWEDQAASNNASDANLASPDFRDNISDNINGNPVVEFNGTDDGLDLGSNNIFSSGTGMTWFAVVEPNSTSGQTRQRIIDFGQYDEAGYGFSYGSEAYGFYTSTASNGAVTEDVSHARGTATTLVSFQIDFANDQEISFNGGSALSNQAITLADLADDKISQSATHGTDDGPFTIGQQSQSNELSSNGGRFFNGKVAEITGYSSDLSANEKNRIETYLAIKYGLTLAHNYVADVDGLTTIFDISGYGNDVAGIGQDDSNQDLNQLSSRSVNSSSLITGTVADANIDEDEYIIWGHNGASDTLNITFQGSANTRLGRIWKVTETGSVGEMTIAIDTSVSPGLTFLVVSNSATISSTADLTGSYGLSLNGANYETTVDFNSNSTQYFTFISSAPGGVTFPGVVSDDLEVWFKADEGVLNGLNPATDGQEVNTWEDVSGNLKNASDTNLDAPDYRNNASDNINGNPVVEFNGSTDGLDLGSNYVFSATSGMTWFAVLQPNTETGKTRQRIVDFGEYTGHGYGFEYGSEAYGFYSSTTAEGGQGTGATTADQAHTNSTNPTLVVFQIDFNTNQSIAFNGNSALSTQAISLLSLSSTNINEAATQSATDGPVTLGHQSMTNNVADQGGRRFSGKMAEVIGYSAAMSTANRSKVESYLAIKYGLTLNHNYTADISGSDETVYDTTGFSNDIAGVGKDILGQGLNHLTSSSINSGALVNGIISSGNIDDEEYIIWGHDGAASTLTSTFESDANSRLDRIWKVMESGNPGEINISIPTSVAVGLLYIIISNTPVLDSVTDLVASYPLVINGSNYEATVNFNSSSTQYFTFTSSGDAALPVNLTSFSARSVNKGVELKWTTASQSNNAGFEVWRAQENNSRFELIADYKSDPAIAGEGNSSQEKEYIYIDADVIAGRTYTYKLSDVDYSGIRTYHNTLQVEVESMLKEFKLYANYPNPFNPLTKIRFYVPDNKAHHKVTIKVYNVIGQLVNTLLNEKLDGGEYTIDWNSENNQGIKLPSGIYFLEFKAGDYRYIRKMMLIK